MGIIIFLRSFKKITRMNTSSVHSEAKRDNAITYLIMNYNNWVDLKTEYNQTLDSNLVSNCSRIQL